MSEITERNKCQTDCHINSRQKGGNVHEIRSLTIGKRQIIYEHSNKQENSDLKWCRAECHTQAKAKRRKYSCSRHKANRQIETLSKTQLMMKIYHANAIKLIKMITRGSNTHHSN
jgi:hypothetical protein